jgi:hypothetical protein
MSIFEPQSFLGPTHHLLRTSPTCKCPSQTLLCFLDFSLGVSSISNLSCLHARFAFGLLLWCLFCGRPRAHAWWSRDGRPLSRVAVAATVLEGNRPDLRALHVAAPGIAALVERCWDQKPMYRPKAEAIAAETGGDAGLPVRAFFGGSAASFRTIQLQRLMFRDLHLLHSHLFATTIMIPPTCPLVHLPLPLVALHPSRASPTRTALARISTPTIRGTVGGTCKICRRAGAPRDFARNDSRRYRSTGRSPSGRTLKRQPSLLLAGLGHRNA